MKPSSFNYYRPDDLGTALRILSSEDDAKLIAGGQSLGPMMNFRVSRPKTLVDISRLAELGRIEGNGDSILIGGAVRHVDFEDGRVPSPIPDLFPRIALGIAYRAVRNRGTVAGAWRIQIRPPTGRRSCWRLMPVLTSGARGAFVRSE